MVWTPPKKWRPQENLVAAELNQHLRDNQLATLAGQTPVANGIAATRGPNSVGYRSVVTATKSTTSTTTSTSPVNVGPTINGIQSSGRMLLMFNAEIAISTSSQFAYFCVGYTSGGQVSLNKAVITSDTARMTLSAHVLYYEAPTSVDLTGWLWTSGGGATATLYRSFVTVWPM